MSDLQSRLGGAIRQLRHNRGITQDELAKKAGLHRTYVSDMERGSRNPSLNSLQRVAEALGITLSEIFKHTELANAGPADANP
jgi:transcriptional regulator with XRE-family HTH domain